MKHSREVRVRHAVEGDSHHLQSRQSHGGPKPQLATRKQTQFQMIRFPKIEFPFSNV